MQSRSSTVWTACALLILGLSSTAQAAATREKAAQASEAAQGVQMVPSGKGYGVPARADQVVNLQQSPEGFGIDYHGGPVMGTTKKGVRVYMIWYGNWATQSPTGKTIVNDMFTAIKKNNPYFGINTTYYQNNDPNQKVRNKIIVKGQIDDNYSQGTTLSDAAILTIVSSAINTGKLPKDTEGVYFVLTTKDVNKTGFCSSYCGWHSNATISGANIKYSFVGDAARCITSCAAQSTSPNDNPGVDGMASVIMHELEEAATDPNVGTGPYAWYENATGMENADKCAWTFGTQLTAPNGSKYNVQWGPRKFLIQRNWVNAAPSGRCDLHL